MTATFDVAIIGGGAVGAACARELAVAGRKVVVLERGSHPGNAWQAAAGMLAPQIEAHADDPLFDLGLAGRERYRILEEPLLDATGIDIGFWQEGIGRVAVDEADVVELRSRVAWQRQRGHVCDWLAADEVRARFPWISPTLGALWAPREGAVEPERVVAALLADAKRHGAVVIQDEITALDRRGDRVVGAVGKDRYAAGTVVLAAGAWSGRLEGLPRPVSVEPVRGQMAALPWPAKADRAIIYRKDCYIVHRNDEAIVGSTREYEGFKAETTSAGLAHIFSAMSALCPTLATADVRRTWAGLRPTTPDGLPIIGPEPMAAGLWYATGHGRNGILLAAITGLVVRQLMDGEPTVEGVEALRPERFWRI